MEICGAVAGMRRYESFRMQTGRKDFFRIFSIFAAVFNKIVMKGVYTVALLIVSNVFMTFAWYGQLRMKGVKWFDALPLILVVLLSWGVALFEYLFQVPANRIGFQENGGPFSLFQLKVIQEVVSLTVFTLFALIFFKTETFRWNHAVAFVFLILAVYFVFKK